MSKTAFRYDLNDPKMIQDFAELVQSPERLKLLLVLTVADIRGVGPNIWNGWKAALMRDLIHGLSCVVPTRRPSRSSAIEAQQLVREGLVFWSDKEFAAHVSNLPVSIGEVLTRVADCTC